MLLRVLRVSAAWRVVCVLLLLLGAQVQQAFDTSASLLPMTMAGRISEDVWNAWAAPFVRWDTLYFVAAASPEGYKYEQELAFQPGTTALLRILGYAPRIIDAAAPWSANAAVVLGAALANAATIVAPCFLCRYVYTTLV